MERFSPLAPAHIRVLVLPVARFDRARFLRFLSRLQHEGAIVPLARFKPQPGDADVLLAPKPSAKGSILFNYSASLSNEQQLQLSPFELFREPLLVLGIADGRHGQDDGTDTDLGEALEYLRERHSRVVDRQLIVLGKPDGGHQRHRGAPNISFVDEDASVQNASLHEALSKISARFLRELSTYTEALKASPSIQTPGQTARRLQRTLSQRDTDKRPDSSSGRSTPVDPISPVDDVPKLPPWNHASPATSFDQISMTNSTSGNLTRSDSRTSNKGKRASSQDRVSLQGFGSNTSQDKLKQRGKARVGIVIGTIHMMAGQWSDALRVLTEHTNKARIMSDSIWHAKGLENIVMCLMLHSWVELEFQLPSICYPTPDRSSQRFSVNLSSKTGDAVQSASLRSLSSTLPELLKLVLSLYRSGEGSLELLPAPIAECTVRCGRLLAVMHTTGGELTKDSIDGIIRNTRQHTKITKPPSTSNGLPGLTKAFIAEMLLHAQTASFDGVPEADHIAILGGMAVVYAHLGMERKKGMALRDLLHRVTAALNQARRPDVVTRASHSATIITSEMDTDASYMSGGDGDGMEAVMAELARIYGFDLMSSTESGDPSPSIGSFRGSKDLKLAILRNMSSFHEAALDARGVLRINASVLKTFGPHGAVDAETKTNATRVPADELIKMPAQLRRATEAGRKTGSTQAEIKYWDSFLVRGIEFVPPDASRVCVERSKLLEIAADAAGTPNNPLLYDPTANRPRTSDAAVVHMLVEGESTKAIVTLQNPYDISLDIESLQLVTEEAALEAKVEGVVLGPLRLQRVPITVLASSKGDCKVIGCRIKINGCVEQVFPIFSKPWLPAAPTVIKDSEIEDLDSSVAEHVVVSARAIEAQPLLTLESVPFLESSLMLLEGEERTIRITLKNVSGVPATLFNVLAATIHAPSRPLSGTHPANTTDAQPVLDSPLSVNPGATTTVAVPVLGSPGLTDIKLAFHYSREGELDQYARVATVEAAVTVNASLQVRNLDIFAEGEDNDETCLLAFDLGNAWPNPLSYSCDIMPYNNAKNSNAPISSQKGILAAGSTERITLSMSRLSSELAAESLDTIRKSILESLKITWHTASRTGRINTTNLPLTKDALTAAVRTSLHLSLDILTNHKTPSTRKSPPVVSVGTFTTLRATLTSDTSSPKPLFVQMQTRALDSTSVVSEERRIVAVGATRRVVRGLEVGGQEAVDFLFCPMLVGMVELWVGVTGTEGEVRAVRGMRVEVV